MKPDPSKKHIRRSIDLDGIIANMVVAIHEVQAEIAPAKPDETLRRVIVTRSRVEYCTVKEAAAILHCHPDTVRQLIRSFRLKPGRGYLINRKAIDAFIQKLQTERVQASLEHRSEKKCQSQKETAYGMSIFGHRAAKELDGLLERTTSKRH